MFKIIEIAASWTIIFIPLVIPNQLEGDLGIFSPIEPVPTAYGLIIGPEQLDVSKINSKYGSSVTYGGTDFVHADVEHMTSALQVLGFPAANISNLSGRKVSKDEVFEALNQIQKKSSKNDLVFIYFTGHGDQVIDRAPIDEPDGLDEVLVLSDDYLFDDELNNQLKLFNKGQRIVMAIDACHSGTTFQFIGTTSNKQKELEKKVNALKKKSNKLYEDELVKNQAFDFGTCSINGAGISSGGINMIYFGASTDSEEAKANISGSYFTSGFTQNFRPYPATYHDLTYRSLFCEVGKFVQTKSGGSQAVQYKEIGNVKDILNEFPLKIK